MDSVAQKVYNCRAASVSEQSEDNDRVPFEILVGICMPARERRWRKRADYASGCCSCANFDQGCTSRRSSVSSALQAVRSQSIGFRRSRHAPSHTLLCAGSMRSGQLLSVRRSYADSHRAHNLYKCWITLCWCTKYPAN